MKEEYQYERLWKIKNSEENSQYPIRQSKFSAIIKYLARLVGEGLQQSGLPFATGEEKRELEKELLGITWRE